MHKPMQEVIPEGVKRYETSVTSFQPEQNSISTADNSTIKCDRALSFLVALAAVEADSPNCSLERNRYDFLVVAPGLKIDFDAVKGLREGLENPNGPVSSIYSVDSCEKTWKNIQSFKEGRAVSVPFRRESSGWTPLIWLVFICDSQIFTQPAGIIKCAGAPQKVRFRASSGALQSVDRRAGSPRADVVRHVLRSYRFCGW